MWKQLGRGQKNAQSRSKHPYTRTHLDLRICYTLRLTKGWPKADPQTDPQADPKADPPSGWPPLLADPQADPQADPKADLWRGRSRISFLTTTMRSPPISWRPAAEIRVKGSVSRDFPPQIIKTLLPLLHYKKNGIGSLHERLWKTTFFLSFNLKDSN